MALLVALLLSLFAQADPLPEGGAPPAADALLVQLKPRVAVTRSPVVLSDVAELRGPKSEVERLGKLEICPAPAAGKPRFVTSAGVRLAARLAGVAITPEAIVGAKQVEVVASWRELPGDELFAVAQRWILDQTAELGDRVLLERLQKPATLALLDGAPDPTFDCAFVSKPRGAAQVLVKVTVRQGEMVVGERVASFKVRRFGKQLLLLTAVRRGETIAPSQVMASDGEWTSLGGTPVLSPIELDGMVATRDLEAGSALLKEQLEQPQIAAQGDSVQLVLRAGALEIVVVGTAQRAGRRGEVVPVLNPTTQKVIQAELISRGAAGLAVALVR